MKVRVNKFPKTFGLGIYVSKSPSAADPVGLYKYHIGGVFACWTILFTIGIGPGNDKTWRRA